MRRLTLLPGNRAGSVENETTKKWGKGDYWTDDSTESLGEARRNIWKQGDVRNNGDEETKEF